MDPVILTLKFHSINMSSIEIHICRFKKNPEFEIQNENHGKQQQLIVQGPLLQYGQNIIGKLFLPKTEDHRGLLNQCCWA